MNILVRHLTQNNCNLNWILNGVEQFPTSRFTISWHLTFIKYQQMLPFSTNMGKMISIYFFKHVTAFIPPIFLTKENHYAFQRFFFIPTLRWHLSVIVVFEYTPAYNKRSRNVNKQATLIITLHIHWIVDYSIWTWKFDCLYKNCAVIRALDANLAARLPLLAEGAQKPAVEMRVTTTPWGKLPHNLRILQRILQTMLFCI